MGWIDDKYIRLLKPHLAQCKESTRGVFNFRCPICGDSKKNSTKTRGYLFPKQNKYFFMCHNCGASMTLNNFISKLDPTLHKEYRVEIFKENRGSSLTRTPKKGGTTTLNHIKRGSSILGKTAVSHAQHVSKIKGSHPVKDYLVNRKIPQNMWNHLYYVDSINNITSKLTQYDGVKFDNYPRLILPFITSKGLMTHMQGRSIDPNTPKEKRYITLELVPDVTKVFGMDRADTSSLIKVVEGPIDSLFLHNAIAMGGSDIDYSSLNPKKTTFIFDNERRNNEITKRMRMIAKKGFGVCVWGKDISDNDVNDMVLSGITNLDEYIEQHTYRGLRASVAISDFII